VIYFQSKFAQVRKER